ncbi:MAG: hypothetical protein IPN59_00670 [Holophaga sp.]|nr:hypothetical protein [Holophaga sp.]
MATIRAMLLLVLASGSAFAQTSLFNDGPAFGGSRVFSEGLNPLGNAARFDRPATGTYLSWTQGDAGGKETLEALKTGDLAALGGLADNSWGLRTRAYGISYADKGVHSSYTHEEMTAALVNPNLGAPAPNTLALRRAVVDRTCVGAGSFDRGSGYGIVMRIERWRMGSQGAQAPTPGSQDYLAFTGTQTTTTLVTFDLGYTLEIAQGIRFGATADRLLARHFGDVYEGPLFRAGFQVDLGSIAQLSVDSDINRAMRMPFPIRQRVTTASLRLMPSPILTLAFGAERRSLGGEPLIRGGVSLFLNSPTWRLGAGFQFSQERPMMGLAFSGF